MGADFSNQKVLVVGGSSGIGLELSRQLAAAGANLWLLGRDPRKLAAAKTQVEEARRVPAQTVATIAADVTDFAQVSLALGKLIKDSGVPDMVINSAGQVIPGYFETLTLDDYHTMMDVDYYGTLHVLKVLVPEMIARRSGRIVNMSSIAGLVGWYGYAAYGSAKYAVRGLSEQLRTELKPFGIQVTAVFPPDVDTPGLAAEKLRQPPELKALSDMFNKPAPVARIAKVILTGVARGQYTIIPGFDNRALVFVYNAFPWIAFPILDGALRQVFKQTHSTRHS